LEIDGLTGKEVELKFFNVAGQLVSLLKLPVENGKIIKTIELSSKLSSGTYYLGIYEGKIAKVVQFVKE
jgi:hypothetical protein